ncbi:Ger(x)C family spore germination protein [Cohnella panacarvi]|uniref:Ger(x)C family spore germination protein n=1 Tax=Cohnella panacarvi TaxID=400776 RepID=UPI00047D2EC5|nr:Ger(x)C family spore germination protein [Cohnella panacarvi]
MRNVPRILILTLVATLLAGCGDKRILEDLGFTQTTSYDLLPTGELDITLSIPLADPEAKSKRMILRTTSVSSKESRIKMAMQTHLNLVSGQLRNSIFGLTLSKEGIWNHIDTLIRDPSISPQVKVTVINGNAGELLRKDYKQQPRTGKYIDKMLQKEAEGQNVPKVTLYHFARDYYDDGIDPIAPVLKDIGDHIAIDGIGLFRDDRYMTKIEPKDALIFAFLRGRFKQGELSVDLSRETHSDKQMAMLSGLMSTRKVKVNLGRNGQTTVTFAIRITGSILEYIGPYNLSDHSDKKKLENQIASHIIDKSEVMVRMMQKHKVDSLGIGTHVRNRMSYKAWKSMNWNDDVYPKVRVLFDVSVKIKDYGKFR